MANATPTTPKDQFSGRTEKGLGVSHRKARTRTALFANTPIETMNLRNFVCTWMDFQYFWEVDTTNIWTQSDIGVVATESFTLSNADTRGVALLEVGQATEDTGTQIQDTAGNPDEIFDPIEQHIACWEARVDLYTPVNSDWFVGLCIDDTSLLSTAGAMTATNYIGFHHTSDSADISLVQNSTAGDAITIVTDPVNYTLIEAPFYRLGIRLENNANMYWYIDDEQVGSTAVGNAETGGTVGAFGVAGLCSSFAVVNGDGGAGAINIDYLRAVTTRY
jgi:hypothetical protein